MKTKLEPPFDELFFVPRIADELNRYITNPAEIPPIVCLYGRPGLGKTAFSKLFAKTNAEHYQYIAMNEHTRDSSSNAFKQKLLFNRHTLRMSPENHAFETATVLDEFHNLSFNSQDVFKVMFDRLIENYENNKNTDLVIMGNRNIWLICQVHRGSILLHTGRTDCLKGFPLANIPSVRYCSFFLTRKIKYE